MPAVYRPTRVLFRVAAGPRVGLGHLVRALSLADAMGVVPLLSVRGGAMARATARSLGGRLVPDRCASTTLAAERPQVLVIDDRVARATRAWRQAATAAGIPTVGFHDLGLGLGPADVIVDGSVKPASDVPAGAVALLGPRYAVLNTRTVGRRSRSASGEPRVPAVLIALGGGPRLALAGALARSICRRCPASRVMVARGVAPGGRTAAGDRITLVPWALLGRQLARATVAVVSGGMSLYEACALGVPTVGVAVHQSQQPTVAGLAAMGAVVDGGAIGWRRAERRQAVERVAAAVDALLRSAATRGRLSRTAHTIVDGRGARRVAAVVAGLVRDRGARPSGSR